MKNENVIIISFFEKKTGRKSLRYKSNEIILSFSGALEKKQSRAEQVVVVKLSSSLRRNCLKNSERRNGKRFQDHICEFFAANNASWYVLVLDLALTSVNNA